MGEKEASGQHWEAAAREAGTFQNSGGQQGQSGQEVEVTTEMCSLLVLDVGSSRRMT